MIERQTPVVYSKGELEHWRNELQDLQGDYSGDPAIRNVISKVQNMKDVLYPVLGRHMEKSRVASKPDFFSYSLMQLDKRAWDEHGKGRNSHALMEIIPNVKVVLINDRGLIEESFKGRLDLRIMTLHSLIHEAVHSIAPNAKIIKKTPSGFFLHEKQGIRHSVIPVLEAGQGKTEPDMRKPVYVLDFLDEALVDELAEEVVRELSSTAGLFSPAELDKFYASRSAPQNYFGGTQRLLNGITRSMAQKTGVEERVVRGSLRRAAIEGRNLFLGDSNVPALDEVLGKHFTRDLSTIHDPFTLEAFIEKYSLE